MGETLVVLSLASSFFFNIDPSQGRQKVILGLLFTMAPFAIVGPFIGPFIDKVRGGHRAVIRGTMVIRSVVAILMMIAVITDSAALFVEAFAMLVLAKTYQIARAAVVPSTVAGEIELVEANSKLQLLSSVGSTVAGIIGGGFLLFGEPVLLAFTAVVFAIGAIAALRLHPSAVGAADEETAELRPVGSKPVVSSSLSVAAFSMGMIRAVVGFVTFLMAFELRGGGTVSLVDRAANLTLSTHRQFDPRTSVPPLGDGPPIWYFGVVLAASVIGGLLGAMFAPKLRARVSEERMQVGACLLAVGIAVATLFLPGLAGFTMLSLGTALAAALAKQAFDAAVQRDIVESDRGQIFARYESRFQVAWVAGALLPAALTIPISSGAIVVMAAAAVAAAALALGIRPALTTVVDGKRQVKPYVSRSGKSGISKDSSSSGNG